LNELFLKLKKYFKFSIEMRAKKAGKNLINFSPKFSLNKSKTYC